MTPSTLTNNVARLGTIFLLLVTQHYSAASKHTFQPSQSTDSSSPTTYNFTIQFSQFADPGDPPLSISQSHFPGPHANRRMAYCRWRTWLLAHPALLNKVPPTPKTANTPGEDAMEILIMLSPVNILEVDVAKQTATLAFKLEVSWQDPALALSSTLIDQFTEGNASSMPHSIIVPSASVWKPSLKIAEGVSAHDILEDIRDVHVDADGNVNIVNGLVVSFACSFDMEAYPFDQHKCTVTVFDISGTSKLVLSGVPWEKDISDRYGVAGEWTLVDTTNGYTEDGYTPQFTLHLKRESTFYVIVTIVPMVLTSYLNVLVFFLPPDLGDKMSYLVTITISMSVYTSFFNQDMPRGLQTVPTIFYLLVFVFAEGFVTMLMSLVVLRKYHYEQHQQRHQQGQQKNPVVGPSASGKGRKIDPEEMEMNATTPPEFVNSNGRNNSDLGEGDWWWVGSVKRPEAVGKGELAAWKVSARSLDFVFFLIVFTINTIVMAILLALMM